MHKVAELLERLDLGEYAESFARNRIDFEVLPRLRRHAPPLHPRR